MSSADPRAAEATAWQRKILDELGAPPAGLARLSPKGTPPPALRPRRPEPAAAGESPASQAPDPYGPAPRRTVASAHARQLPAAPAPPPPSVTRQERVVGSPSTTRQEPVVGTPPAPAESTTFDPPSALYGPAPARRNLPAAERTTFDPPAPPPARPRPRPNPAAETMLDPPRPGTNASPFTTPPRRDQPLKAPVARTSAPAEADPHPESLLRRSRHGDPMLRRLAREVRKVTGASQDSFQDATLAEAIQQPVTTGRRIAVTSIRGGAGKSVVAALIATAMAHFRQDRVLAVDADPGIGSLPLRLGMTSAPSLRSLIESRADAGSFEAIRSHLAQTDAGVWALGGAEGRFADVDLRAYRNAGTLLGRYFGVTVTDCGAGLTGELTNGILDDAHAQVLVTPATPDGAISARKALDLLAGTHAELAGRTTVVFVTHAAGAGLDLDRAIRTMPPWLPRVEHLAFDRHLADGSIIDAARLAEPTRVAALRVAAAALTLAAGRSLPQ